MKHFRKKQLNDQYQEKCQVQDHAIMKTVSNAFMKTCKMIFQINVFEKH